jgi:hypothetical protein
MRPMGSCDCRTPCGLSCRCVSLTGGLSGDPCAFMVRAGEASGEAEPVLASIWGKRARSFANARWLVRVDCTFGRSAALRRVLVDIHARSSWETARFRRCCFPPASPTSAAEAGKQKTAPRGRSKIVISLKKSGAGEGIRTPDPNRLDQHAEENSSRGTTFDFANASGVSAR